MLLLLLLLLLLLASIRRLTASPSSTITHPCHLVRSEVLAWLRAGKIRLRSVSATAAVVLGVVDDDVDDDLDDDADDVVVTVTNATTASSPPHRHKTLKQPSSLSPAAVDEGRDDPKAAQVHLQLPGVPQQDEVRPASPGQVPPQCLPRAGQRGLHLPVQQRPHPQRFRAGS